MGVCRCNELSDRALILGVTEFSAVTSTVAADDKMQSRLLNYLLAIVTLSIKLHSISIASGDLFIYSASALFGKRVSDLVALLAGCTRSEIVFLLVPIVCFTIQLLGLRRLATVI
jgi:hypothetical protein